MKYLLLIPALLAASPSFASEFDRRRQIREDRIAEIIRQGDEAYAAETDDQYAHAIAQSLGVARSQIESTGRSTWRTLDGSIVCGVANGGFGGAYIQCLDRAGNDVGGLAWFNGKMVDRSGRSPAKGKRTKR